jgi:WD40 repeat protein
VWDLNTNTEIATLNGHTSAVVCCAVFAEGRRALSGSRDNTLKVWNLDSNTEIATLTGHSGAVTCCTVFAEGTRALSGSYDSTLKVWDLDTNTVITTLNGHSEHVRCCAVFSACNSVFKRQNLELVYAFLACGSSKLTDDNGEGAGESSSPIAKRAKVSNAGTTSAAPFTDDEGGGVALAETHEYRSTKFHDVCVIRGVIRRIFEFAREHDSDERRAISGSGDGTLKVWDLESYTEISTIETGYDGGVWCFDVFADGTPRVLTDSGDGSSVLNVWG